MFTLKLFGFVLHLVALWEAVEVPAVVALTLDSALRTLAGVEFVLDVSGPELLPTARVRVVESDVACGEVKALVNTPSLRGPLARSLNASGDLLAIDGPLRFSGLKLISSGIRRVCLCSGGSLCERGEDFDSDVGTFVTVAVTRVWVDPCPRAKQPFRAHVSGFDLRASTDRILLAWATDVCGEAEPRASYPSGQVSRNFGFASLRCDEDPNAGSVPMERKLVCGDRKRSLQVAVPGLYRVCVCVALPGYDCSSISHYTLQAGEAFAVASPGGALVGDSIGGAIQLPSYLGGAGGAVLAMAHAPLGEGPAAWGPDRLAVGSEDGVVRLWEPVVPRFVAALRGHSGLVSAVAWSPDASWLVSGGVDGMIRVWGAVAGAGRGQEQPHVCPLWAHVWERPGGDASDTEWQNTIFGFLLEVMPENVTELPREEQQDLIPSSDLKDAAELTWSRAALQCSKVCPAYREMATRYCDCGQVFECHLVKSCAPRCGLDVFFYEPAPNQRVTAVAVSPDGRLVVSASGDSIRVWNFAKDIGEAMHRNTSTLPIQVLNGHLSAVLTLAFAPSPIEDNPLFASGGADGDLFWYNSLSYYNKSLPFEDVFLVHTRLTAALGFGEAILTCAFSTNGGLLAAAGSHGGAVWDTKTRTQTYTFDSGVRAAAVAGLVISPDSKWVAWRGAENVQVFPLRGLTAAEEVVDENVVPTPAPTPATDWTPPGSGAWVPYATRDMTKATIQWSIRSGPAGNMPRYEVLRASDGSVSEIHFFPCMLNLEEGDCIQDLPVIQMGVEAPFDFIAVRGSFVEFSIGENFADDCRGGLKHSSWLDLNASYAYFTEYATGRAAEGEDCEQIGPLGSAGNYTVEACQRECAANRFCNAFNYRQHPPGCDLRRCLDIQKIQLVDDPDKVVHVYVTRAEADRLLHPTHDGYVMFGAPKATGEGGVVYGGCDAGPDLPSEGVTISIRATPVARTRQLRWQVSQSRKEESLGIRDIQLELFRADASSHFLTEVSGSPAIAFAPKERRLAAAVGDTGSFAVWDLFGLDVVPFQGEFRLKGIFNISISSWDLQDEDVISVVLSEKVPHCGDAYSSISSRDIQGLAASGRRTFGTLSGSMWTGLVATAPNYYRVCMCRAQAEACCSADGDFAIELGTFLVAGANSEHHFLCEVTPPGGDPRECRFNGVTGIGLKTNDQIMVQDGLKCGLGKPVAGVPSMGVVKSRDFIDPDTLVFSPGGAFYRFEDPNQGMKVLPISSASGFTARLCWCPAISSCNPASPEEFNIEAGLVTVMRLQDGGLSISCIVGVACELRVDLNLNQPLREGDQAVVVAGIGTPPSNKFGRQTYCGKAGEWQIGIGPQDDGKTSRMSTIDGPVGVFGFGTPSTIPPGVYRLCWCESSSRPCSNFEDFSFDIGELEVVMSTYVWPACSLAEAIFSGWRTWSTFDECCCNYHESGAVGCQDPKTQTYQICSQLPRR